MRSSVKFCHVYRRRDAACSDVSLRIRGVSAMLRLLLLVNTLVALVTSGGALVVLLIAPLGLAAVVSCTLLVAALTFSAGLAADLLLWRRLQPGAPGAASLLRPFASSAGLALPSPSPRARRLPQR